MSEKDKKLEEQVEETKPGKPESDDQYTLALEDMEEFIESQGIYIRQQISFTYNKKQLISCT